ncbi:MAG TPA: hypothetical protein VLT35_01295 [Methanocella sp.]|nr:hypothetical protein [Methanocella sp.]
MMKNLVLIFATAALLMAALAMPAAAQQADTKAYDQQVLQLRYESVSARVGFTTGVMADVVSLVPNASDLNAHIDRLNADLSTLSGYVAAGDPSGFSSFVSGTIDPDMQDANKAVLAARAHFREWGVTAETRAQLKTMYDQRKATFEARMNNVVIGLGNLRLTHYNDAVAKYDDRMTKLSAKGVDVSGMQAVEAGAQASVIGPLQTAIASADPAAVKAELKDKCLGNGAPYSYHFWAKMDTAGGQAISARVADNATQAGYGEQLAQVNAELATAQSTLDSVGTNPYTIEQKSTIWDSLKAAADGLKDLIKLLGGH